MTYVHVALSRPFSEARDRYAAIVVGSGYGGGVAASRLARAGVDVALLERGREIAPGDYPRSMAAAVDEFQVTLSETGQKLGPRKDGLYDLRINEDMNVLIGCGLGGTSLINANVAIEPDPRVYGTWPKKFHAAGFLDDYYARARKMLGSRPYPMGKTNPKLEALRKVSEGLGVPFSRPDINVTFETGPNAAGVHQIACNDCGDCVSGCNYGAKNTTLMNYLPDAKRHGAEIFTGAEVHSLARDGEDWVLSVASPDGDTIRAIRAGVVVLAAGTLGSNEILLRSSGNIALSERLGKSFSGNGDVWAFGYNANIPQGAGRAPVRAVGAGDRVMTPDTPARYRPGPCITGLVDLRDGSEPLEKGLIIEEGAMPGALAPGYAAGFPALDALIGDPFRYGDIAVRLKDAEALGKKIEADPEGIGETAYEGPLSRTLPYLVMSHDDSGGRLRLEHDRVIVDWPKAGSDRAILHDADVVRQSCDVIQAEYLPNPIWQDDFGNRLVTVHPLGGCGMGEDADSGVIDDKCRVFDPGSTGKHKVHKGLYVMDGAAIPRGLGVNPHLTITALAEYAVEQLCADHKWTIDFSDKPPLDAAPAPALPHDHLGTSFDIMGKLSDLDRAIADGDVIAAKSVASEIWTKFGLAFWWYKPKSAPDLPSFETVWSVVGTDLATLDEVLRPIIDQILLVVPPVLDAVEDGHYVAALDLVQEAMSDISPPVTFSEEMSGHLTALGLDDPPPAFDPFKVAGDGPVNTTLTARISADHVITAITPPKGKARIENGKLASEKLGDFTFSGTFRFLMPDPTRIECWEMTYEGPLTCAKTGRALTFEGRKTLKRRQGSDWWRDLTDLSVTIRDDQTPVAHGMLHVGFENVLDQAENLTVAYGDLAPEITAVFNRVAATVAKDKRDLPATFADHGFRADLAKAALCLLDNAYSDAPPSRKLAEAFKSKVFARMGGLVLRSYGGIFSYLSNFPSKTFPDGLPPAKDLPEPEFHYPSPTSGVRLKLTRYKGGNKGPVMLAGGFGVKASSFATPTVDENIVQTLTRKGFDVWLFDYRGSGDIASSLDPFTIDDVARKDWPAAISTVLARTGATSVQAVVHCVGSMSLFMAILAGETRVRRIVSSQLAAHAITNWFNFAKGDADTADWFVNGAPKKLVALLAGLGLDERIAAIASWGVPYVDPRSPSEPKLPYDLDPTIDGMLWGVPSFAPVPCYSPTCHRINFIFGPSYRHEQLNQATHDAIRHMFGPVSTAPFVHLARIFTTGFPVTSDGRDAYLPNVKSLSMPIRFIAGAKNPEMLPEATLRTLNWLVRSNGNDDGRYSRIVFPDNGHMDCFIGRSAFENIFPDIAAFLMDDPET